MLIRRHVIAPLLLADILLAIGSAHATMPVLTGQPRPASLAACKVWAAKQSDDALYMWGIQGNGKSLRAVGINRLTGFCMGQPKPEIVGFGSSAGFDRDYCAKHPKQKLCKMLTGDTNQHSKLSHDMVRVGRKLPYGSAGGAVLTILAKSGLDTKHAVIKGRVTRDDARTYCKSHNEKVTKGCLSETARYARTLKSEIQANCTTKKFTDFFGNRYAFLGLNPDRDRDDGESHARYLLKNLSTGDISNGTDSTGYFKNSALFTALCPQSAPKDW